VATEAVEVRRRCGMGEVRSRERGVCFGVFVLLWVFVFVFELASPSFTGVGSSPDSLSRPVDILNYRR